MVLKLVEKYRKSELKRIGGKYIEPAERGHMEFENKQENMRARTVNKGNPFDRTVYN